MSSSNGYGFLAAYGIIILLVLLAIRTKIGYVLLYYFFAISIVVILLTNYQTINQIFGTVMINPQPAAGVS